MKKYNIVKPEKYTQNGEEKTIWHNIGEVVDFENGKGLLVKIPAIGLSASAFLQTKKEVKKEEEVKIDF
jgi:hypothetical protein